MNRMHDSTPTVNRPEAGLTLLPCDKLPDYRRRYMDLLRTLTRSAATDYVRGILGYLDELQQCERVR